MTVDFWGVRGSIPVPGLSTARFGGNTPCLSIPLDERHTLILDAGTGLRYVPVSPTPEGHTYFFLISHAHWDHIQGFPFFSPRSDKNATLVFLHEDEGCMARRVLDQIDGTHFPLTCKDIAANVVTHVTSRSEVLAPFGLSITDIPLCHPGGASGFLIQSGSGSLLYMTDNELGAGFDYASIPHVQSSIDILVHDAQYTSQEYDVHVGWGHSSMLDAVELARYLGSSKLVLFHHDPARSDEELAILEKQLQQQVAPEIIVHAAREGMTLEW